MADHAKSLSQRTRLVILVLYVAALVAASLAAFDSVLPPTTEKGVWFYSALAALLLGNLIVTPFFTKPSDAIAYSVAALVALLAVNAWRQTALASFDRFLWTIVLLHIVVVLLAGIIAIALKDSSHAWRKQTAATMFVLCDHFGSPRAVFSSVFLFALVAFHRTEPREYLVIGVSWALFVGLHPLESLAGLIERWRRIWTQRIAGGRIGTIVGHEAPNIILIRQDDKSTVSSRELLLARAEHGGTGVALALDHVGFAEGRWLRALHLTDGASPPHKSAANEIGTVDFAHGDVFRADAQALGEGWRNTTWDRRDSLVGLVAPDTRVGLLQIEVVRTDLDLCQGALIDVQIGWSARAVPDHRRHDTRGNHPAEEHARLCPRAGEEDRLVES